MSDGRCSSVCVTDGDWLRDTLSFRTLDAAGAKRYRGWRTRRPARRLPQQEGLQRSPSRQAP